MTLDERLFNNFRNKTLSFYWQQHGLNVIPNVSWSLPDSYDDCFSWIPKHSVIAINCTGIKKHDCSKFLWLKGYHEALKRLEPLQIIRYGEKMPEESEGISVYFPNEQLFKLKCLYRQHSKKEKKIITNQLKIFEPWEETEASSVERHFPQRTGNMKRSL